VVDTSQNLLAIKQYLKTIDVPEKQILIEARIVNMDCQIMEELGLHFKAKKPHEQRDHFHMSLPEVTSGRWNFSIAQFSSPNFLDLELAALESRGKGKILACPKLITQNRKSAIIESGEEIPYQEQTSSGATSVNFKKAALSLKVTPQITSKSQILLSLEINQDKVSSLSVNGTPAIQMQNLKTQVMVKDGQTVILGGIFEEAKNQVDHQLPWLGHLPLVGKLLSDHHTEFSRKELLLFITPKVIEDNVDA
jgi:type IV pilus assembly protein PilQ